jgi:hypothetical protein
MDQQSQKVVTWALGPDTLEELFKTRHGITDSAEVIGVVADPVTGVVLCMFEISDLAFDTLKEADIDASGVMNSEEIYN